MSLDSYTVAGMLLVQAADLVDQAAARIRPQTVVCHRCKQHTPVVETDLRAMRAADLLAIGAANLRARASEPPFVKHPLAKEETR